MQAPARNGQDPSVEFEVPQAAGGQAPVSVTCDPGSGDTFPLGQTEVTCTATDALSRRATCSFTVSVEAVPRLTRERFMAFGDSLTEGVTSPKSGLLMLNVADSYPTKLQALLSMRYIDQDVIVVNEGFAGKHAVDDIDRLEDALRSHDPQVLLLMHGANDLLARRPTSVIAHAIDEMVSLAERHGALVILAGLPPQIPDRQRSYAIEDLPALNAAIERIAVSEGIPFIDMVGAFGANLEPLVGDDGLHLRPAGYERMAEIWFEEIRGQFEEPPAGAPAPVPPETTAR